MRRIVYDPARMAPRSLVAGRSSVSPAPRPPSRARCIARASTRSRLTTWPGAATALGAFVDKSCPLTSTDKRCREACIKLGHAHERLGSPAGAWAAYDAALAFPPHTRDAAVKADLERTQAQLAERRDRGGDQSPVVIMYRDEVGDDFNARSLVVSVDFEPVVTKEKDASDLHGADFRRIWGGSTPVGDHVLRGRGGARLQAGIGRALRALAPAQGVVVQERRARPRHDPDPRLRRGRRGRRPPHPALEFSLR